MFILVLTGKQQTGPADPTMLLFQKLQFPQSFSSQQTFMIQLQSQKSFPADTNALPKHVSSTFLCTGNTNSFGGQLLQQPKQGALAFYLLCNQYFSCNLFMQYLLGNLWMFLFTVRLGENTALSFQVIYLLMHSFNTQHFLKFMAVRLHQLECVDVTIPA